MPVSIGEEGAHVPAIAGSREALRGWSIIPRLDVLTRSGSDRDAVLLTQRQYTEPSQLVAARAGIARSFPGLEMVGSQYGGGIPADTTLARSSARVIELVNRRVRIFSTRGSVLATTDLSRFFGAVDGGGKPSGPPLFDPKVYYDRNSANPRIYAVALQGNRSVAPQMSRLYLAVSRRPNPSSVSTADWCRYFVDTRRAIGTVPDTWADYPGLGAGSDAVVVSTNQFSWPTATSPSQFAGSLVLAWRKADLNQNGASCPSIPAPYEWTADGSFAALPFTMQVGQHFSTPSSFAGVANPVYLVNSVAAEGSRAYQVWRMANVGSGAPLLWGPTRVAGTFRNALPPLAPGGARARIDTGDFRVLQVAGTGDRLLAAHAVACQFTRGTAAESCVRVVRFAVSDVGGSPTAAIDQQFVSGGGDGWYWYYPSIAANESGTAALSFDASRRNVYLGSIWAVKRRGESGLSSAGWFTRGTCLRNVGLTAVSGPDYYRAGDYSGAAADPDGTTLWVAGERAVRVAGIGCAWGTRIARVAP